MKGRNIFYDQMLQHRKSTFEEPDSKREIDTGGRADEKGWKWEEDRSQLIQANEKRSVPEKYHRGLGGIYPLPNTLSRSLLQ